MNDARTLLALGDSISHDTMMVHAAPALAIVAGAGSLALAFATRNIIVGQYRDAQMEARGSTAVVGMWLRNCFSWGMQPVIAALLWLGLPAAALTILALFLAIGAGAALASGWITLGGTLFVLSGICDFLDGRIARNQGTAGPAGALLDSVVDRYVEAVVFMGLAWYYRETWVLVAVLAAMAGSSLVPYVRARGESLGVAFPNIGIVQRPERVAVLGASLLVSPIIESAAPGPASGIPHPVLALGLVLLAVSTGVSSLQRLVHASRALVPADRRPRPRLAGRGSILRNGAAAAIATAVDFSAVVCMVELSRLSPVVATLLGCAIGAVINFLVNRFWAFEWRRPTLTMVARYGFVSSTSAGLNAGLLAILLLLPSLNYAFVWWIVRGTVFLLWNFPLHRDYVFGDSVEARSPVEEPPGGHEAEEAVPPSGLMQLGARH